MRLAAAAYAGLSAGLFWTRGIAQLYARHPHEDAFILFRYAEHLASGAGIVFNLGGAHTEGATDFLWLCLLSACVGLGLDVAVAAVLLNAIGCGAITFLLLLALWSPLERFQAAAVGRLLFGLFLASVTPFLGAALASYDGFGTELYCALLLATHAVHLAAERPEQWARLPYFGLILGLFRPDGAILGVGYFALSLVRCRRSSNQRRALLRHGSYAALAGLAYFTFRGWYFGELLPLPLFVKARGPGPLPGLAMNQAWLGTSGSLALLSLAAAFGALLWVRAPARRADVGRVLGAMLPVLALGLALNLAYQSQNVDFRFQAPIFTVLLHALLRLGAEVMLVVPRGWATELVLVACAASLWPALRAGKRLWPLDYVDSTAVRLSREMTGAVVAGTEAGRLPYWSHSVFEDVVGLNNARAAHAPTPVAEIASLKPDLVMYHVGGALDFERQEQLSASGPDGQCERIEPSELDAALRPQLRRALASNLSAYPADTLPTQLGAAVLSRFLSQSTEFDVFLMRYGDHFSHVWGVRRGRRAEAIERVLRAAERAPYISYANAKGFTPDAASCRLIALGARYFGPHAFGLVEAPRCKR